MASKKYLLYISHNYAFAILRPLQKAIKARGDEVAWFISGDTVNKDYLDTDERVLKTIKEVKLYKACAVFAASNVVPYFFPGIKVELFHGFNAQKRGALAHFKIRGFFDLYCTQGPDTTQIFLDLAKQHGYFKVVETGWPKLDPLFSHNQITTNKMSTKADKPVILFASTFSKNLTAAPHLLETIKHLSKTGEYEWMVTFHPKMDASIVQAYKEIQGEYLNFIETDDVIPLLLKADMMVCDTSSILQEFLLLNKPVVTYKNNNPVDCLIDITDVSELLPAIKQALAKPDDLMQKIREYTHHLHPYDDGKSSERVLKATDEFLTGDDKPLKKKPLNLIRKFKMRKKLGYWF